MIAVAAGGGDGPCPAAQIRGPFHQPLVYRVAQVRGHCRRRGRAPLVKPAMQGLLARSRWSAAEGEIDIVQAEAFGITLAGWTGRPCARAGRSSPAMQVRSLRSTAVALATASPRPCRPASSRHLAVGAPPPYGRAQQLAAGGCRTACRSAGLRVLGEAQAWRAVAQAKGDRQAVGGSGAWRFPLEWKPRRYPLVAGHRHGGWRRPGAARDRPVRRADLLRKEPVSAVSEPVSYIQDPKRLRPEGGGNRRPVPSGQSHPCLRGERRQSRQAQVLLPVDVAVPVRRAAHVGHVRNYTIGDVISRHKRHDRASTCCSRWAGTHSACRRKMPRSRTRPRRRSGPTANIEHMRAQLQSLGLSPIDWSREFATCKPDYYRSTSSCMFVRLLKKGVAYRKNSRGQLGSGRPDGAGQRAGDRRPRLAHRRAGREARDPAVVPASITDYAQQLLDELNTLDGWPDSVKTMQRNWIGRSEGLEIQFRVDAPKPSRSPSSPRAPTR